MKLKDCYHCYHCYHLITKNPIYIYKSLRERLEGWW
uniref:Uncharacterized protein n=1 Tax=Myoviridae sp. ctnhb8 TaxID=2825171 RepID=A0A8S5VEF4_9CAUD|nr:MAG TPA: hypothetical protein [Myoviridae sp. ctnhb8]